MKMMKKKPSTTENLTSGRIILAHPNSDIICRFATSQWSSIVSHWVYLGSDYCRILKLESGELKGLPRISISNVLQTTAENLRETFLKWIEQLGRQWDSLPWWASTIADKNPEISPLFLNICYLHIALELIEKNNSSVLLIVIEKQGLFRQVARLINRNKLLFIDDNFENRMAGLRRAKNYFGFYFHYLIRIFRELKATRQGGRFEEPEINSIPEVMLLTYADDNALMPEGGVKDRFFDRLPMWLTEKGYHISWLPFIYKWTESWAEAVRRVRAGGDCYYLMQDFLSFSDYLLACCKTIFYWRSYRGHGLKFNGLPVGEIFQEEGGTLSSSSYVPDRLVIWSFLKKLSRKRPNIALFIYPYENMSWEKIFCLGVHKFFAKARLVGFQHSHLAPTMLNYFPGFYEWQSPTTPERVVCGGREFYNLLKSQGYPLERLKVGSALRFGELNLILKNFNVIRNRNEQCCILVTFSYIVQDTARLLHCILEAFRDSRELKIWLKPHPTLLPAERLLALLPDKCELPVHFEIVSGRLLDCLKQSDLFIYTSTCSIYEAMALGVPAIHLTSETTIDQDYVTSRYSSIALRTVNGSAALYHAARELLDLSEADRVEYIGWGRELVKRVFAPITEEGLEAFCPIGDKTY